jgi:hypothetical protein
VSGRLAHLGGRLIDFAAKKPADQFFENSSSLLENPRLKGRRGDPDDERCLYQGRIDAAEQPGR